MKLFTKHLVLKLISFIHPSLLTLLRRVISQAEGRGFDSGLSNEVELLSRLLDTFKISDPVIFDVGANVGDWSLRISKKYPRAAVYAFEPSRSTYVELQKRTEKNTSINCFNLGFSDSKSSSTLHFDEQLSGMASLSRRELLASGKSFNMSETVSLEVLDEWTKEMKLTVDLLKIDVEGHELDVLNGSIETLKNVKVVQFEFGGTDIDSRFFFRDFWKFFHDKPFLIYRLTPRGLTAVTDYSEHDEVFSFTTFFAVKNL